MAPVDRIRPAAGLNRRHALFAGVAGTLAAASLPLMARASAPTAGRQAPGIYRTKVGDFELTAINDGVNIRKIDESFIKNAPLDEVKAALEEAFLPPDQLPITFTQLVVNTGQKIVLIDTGTGGQLAPTAGMMVENLEAAGIDAKAVDTVIISHFHGDHILGLRAKDGAATFPNAEVLVPEPEWAFWMDEGQMSRAPEGLKGGFAAVHKVFDPIAGDVERFAADQEIVPGITAHAAYGHTPGHMIFRIASGAEQMIVLSDVTNHPALFVTHPGWHAVFDMDPVMAEATRRRVLDMVSADRLLVQGYHFPFPASGHVAKRGDGYAFVPVAWNPIL